MVKKEQGQTGGVGLREQDLVSLMAAIIITTQKNGHNAAKAVTTAREILKAVRPSK
jgi:urease gamma subunit